MGEPAINSRSNHRVSLSELEVFAAEIGEPPFQEQAAELRAFAAPGPVAPTPEQALVLNIRKKWESIYGANISLWPNKLQDSLRTMDGGIGLSSFNNGVISALQNLILLDETCPAFEIVLSVMAKSVLPDLSDQALQLQTNANSGIIPQGAARAGLRFVSDPAMLMIPIWSASLFGRATVEAASAFGEFLCLAEESVAALSFVAKVLVEAAAFVGATEVVAPSAGQNNDPANRATTGYLSAFTARFVYLAGLKGFNWAGAVVGSFLPLTETGAAIAKFIDHATTITGIATMKEVQKTMGLTQVTSHTSQSFSESLWGAGFLYATRETVNTLFNVSECDPSLTQDIQQ